MIHRISKGQAWCGEAVGILVLDESIPRVLGSVLNAETFSFPVRYKKVKGASVERLLIDKDPELLKPFIDAALELQAEGVASIAGSCGFMALFQDEISKAVNVPVAMSSLLQIPIVMKMTGGRRVGVITANEACLGESILYAAGVSQEDVKDRLVIAGLDDCPEAQDAMLREKGSLDEDILRNEVLAKASRLMEIAGGIGAIVLECSELPPYSYDVQQLTKLPVFDFTTMIKFLHMGVRACLWRG